MPSEIGPYTVEREIGRGGMGVVYLGYDGRLDRPVAIKALPEDLGAQAERLRASRSRPRPWRSLTAAARVGMAGSVPDGGLRLPVV